MGTTGMDWGRNRGGEDFGTGPCSFQEEIRLAPQKRSGSFNVNMDLAESLMTPEHPTRRHQYVRRRTGMGSTVFE